MKKVLFAINTLNNGGAEKVLLTLLRYLDPKKYEIHLLVVQYDKTVFVSEAIRVAFGEMFGIELVQNAAVCYNPLEAKTIRRMAKAYKVAHDKFTICAVGRVIPEKGFLRLTSICEHMVEDGRDFTLNIVGDGKEYDRLKEMVESHHLEKWEHLIGFQENPYPYIKNADLFVCSSLNEGYNLAISEAVILGVPVISTDCSGIKENLGNGKWGYIVENRKETLYHVISRCFDEPGFLEELKKKSEAGSIQDTYEGRLKKIESIIEGVVN